MTSLLEQTWHAPPGYRAVLTRERIWTELGDFRCRTRAERRADALNRARQPDALHEWRAFAHGRRWQVVAFRLRLEAIA